MKVGTRLLSVLEMLAAGGVARPTPDRRVWSIDVVRLVDGEDAPTLELVAAQAIGQLVSAGLAVVQSLDFWSPLVWRANAVVISLAGERELARQRAAAATPDAAPPEPLPLLDWLERQLPLEVIDA